MARIFVTGSTEGVGRNAAEALIKEGHAVVLHARNAKRAEAFSDLAGRAEAIITGDLASLAEIRAMASQLNTLGTMDAIIHNAGVIDDSRVVNEDSLLRVLTVNTLAPYMLSILADAPRRLIFTGSSMHRGHDQALTDLDWSTRRWSGSSAYGESKLLVCALSAALARRWPDTLCNAVDPGWVPTRMGGPSASDDLRLAHATQCWLATSDDAEARTSGGYWFHMHRQTPDPKVENVKFQDEMLRHFADMTGVSL